MWHKEKKFMKRKKLEEKGRREKKNKLCTGVRSRKPIVHGLYEASNFAPRS